MNFIEACIDKKIKKVIVLSTCKASSPINLPRYQVQDIDTHENCDCAESLLKAIPI